MREQGEEVNEVDGSKLSIDFDLAKKKNRLLFVGNISFMFNVTYSMLKFNSPSSPSMPP